MLFRKKSFTVRVVGCFLLLLVLAFSCVVRLIFIAETATPAMAQQNAVTVQIEDGRGMIYDCSGNPVYSAEKYACVFLPCEKSLQSIGNYCSGETLSKALQKLQQNTPVVLQQNSPITQIGVYTAKIISRKDIAYGMENFLGYLDGEGVGQAGIEAAYNTLLVPKEKCGLSFAVDAAGNCLTGRAPILKGNKNSNAVFLTVDLNLQKTVYEAAQKINLGGVLVTEIETGKIRAMVSKPGYSVADIGSYLTAQDSPFLNRCLSCYNVGSAFKPLIAAVLLENNKHDFALNCTGKSEISGRVFHCHAQNGHGTVTLAEALAQSCNCYFYRAAELSAPENYLNTAWALQFAQNISLAKGLCATAGNLPSAGSLTGAALANFSIGQGELLLSPLALTNLYAAIANGGWYKSPRLIEATRENGVYKKTENPAKTAVFSTETAQQLKSYLTAVLKQGTGREALPGCGAYGKTATAQTGKLQDGKEIEHSWFCGVFPSEKPRYAVTVFIENNRRSAVKATTVFKNIAEGFTGAAEN